VTAGGCCSCQWEQTESVADSRAGQSGAPLASHVHNLLHWLLHFVTIMTESASRFGFVAFAETWNGRLAMLGFVIGLGTELLTGQGILSQIGLG
jgi:hypothetical protein